MNCGILAVGAYSPEKILTNNDLAKIVDTSDEWIVTRTGIKERRISQDHQAASDLAYESTINALKDSDIQAEDIDAIFVATCSQDMIFPSTACILQAKINNTKAVCMDIQAACAGFSYGIVTGYNYFLSGMYKKILVVGTDLLSKFVNWEDRTTCVLFGDGAGSVILGEVPNGYGILGADLGSDGRQTELLYIPAGGTRKLPTPKTLKDKEHTIKMKGAEIFKFAVKNMGESMRRAIERAGIDKSEIDLFIPHQANLRIIDTLAKFFELPREKVYVTVDRFGNTSAASIPMALAEAKKQGLVQRGKVIAMTAFGAGLTWGSVILRWY
ncbi:MAG: beta-ketoacyl-ACP synthase III [Candidatus Hydrogenedentota bacterium]